LRCAGQLTQMYQMDRKFPTNAMIMRTSNARVEQNRC
jgi:hypothetical protein